MWKVFLFLNIFYLLKQQFFLREPNNPFKISLWWTELVKSDSHSHTGMIFNTFTYSLSLYHGCFHWSKWGLTPKTIGNRKRDCAWGCAWGINTTWENLQIEKHKSVRWAERTPSWFVLFDLQIFSGGVYSPSATSRTISFSISNSFWC